MDGLSVGLPFKAFVSQSQASLLLGGLTLITLARSQLETLMAILTLWHAPASGFLERPALAFFLLNCVIVTIIASSKFRSDQKQRYQEESEVEIMEQVYGKGDQTWRLGAENILIERKTYSMDTPLKGVHDHHYEEHFLGRSWSINAKYQTNITKHEQAKLNHVNEKKSSRKARLASRKSIKVISHHHHNKPLISTDHKNRQHIDRESFKPSSSEVGSHQYNEKPAPQNNFDTEQCIGGPGRRAGTFINNLAAQQTKGPAAAATAHRTSEEVWAAIMASEAADQDHCMACRLQEERHSRKSSSQSAAATGVPTPPAAAAAALDAVTPAVLPLKTPLASAAAAWAYPQVAAKAACNLSSEVPSKPHTAAAEKEVNGEGNNQANYDVEAEELNHRAEEFIARFHRQMRLQREESLQHCPCNYEVQCPEHAIALKVPAPGLLVG